MDATRLAQVQARGYGIAAAKIAAVFDVYRPAGADDPLDAGNKTGTLNAIFSPHNSAGFSFDRPSDYTSPLFHGMFDFTSVQVFDYFVNANVGTYFVASIDPIVPPLCVQCYRTVSVTRPQGASVVGLNPYGGNVPATEDAVMTNWPASLLEIGKGRNKQTGELPGDVGSGAWQLYLPAVAGVILRDSDILTDDLGRRYVLGTCELQGLGWRCKAMQMVT